MINYASNSIRAQSLVDELSQIPNTHETPVSPRFHILQADVSSKQEVQNLVTETLRIMGRLDAVVSKYVYTRLLIYMFCSQEMEQEMEMLTLWCEVRAGPESQTS